MREQRTETLIVKPSNVIACLVIVLVVSATAAACPVCDTETGKDVRAGIFDEDFGRNAVLTLLPFPVLLAAVAMIHFGFPTMGRPAHRQEAQPPQYEAQHDA